MLNLPDISKAFGEDKSNEQILDSLQKYRKELNFLLMNLDESNMPEIAGRLDGIDGSFSLIQQDLDSITLAVGNAQGDISALSLRADGIDLAVSNNAGSISALSITVGGIQTTVSSHSTTIGTHTSQISQLDNEISSIVSFTDVTGNEIASKINQTATTISLLASKIDLTGITTIYSSVDPTDKVTVSGGYAYFYLNGDNYLRLTAGLQGALITSPSEGQIYFGDNVAVGGDISILYNLHAGSADFTDTPTVGSDVVVIADDAVYINTSTYGIDISAPGKTAITIKWGANLV